MAVQATPSTLNLTLSAEHEDLRRAVRDFARKEILPVAAHFDETGEFPMEIVRKMGAMGLMGIEVPEEYGGAGMDTIAYVLTMEEIAKADAATSTILSVNNSLVCHGLLKFGTEAQKQKYLRDVASGAKIGAYSLTEPMSGSDAGTMKSRAVLSEDGTHYIINGRKSWVTSGPVADYVILFTMTEPEKKHHGITAFIIETDKEGFAAGKKEPKLGIRASATSELIFENYRCPVENVLGTVGQGFKVAMTVLDAGRIGIAAQALGIAEAAYEASVEYARQREAFGAPIGSFQMIQAKIADMKTRIERRGCSSTAPRSPKSAPSKLASATPPKPAWRSSSPARPPCSARTPPSRFMVAWATAASCPSSATSATPKSLRFTRAPARFSAW